MPRQLSLDTSFPQIPHKGIVIATNEQVVAICRHIKGKTRKDIASKVLYQFARIGLPRRRPSIAAPRNYHASIPGKCDTRNGFGLTIVVTAGRGLHRTTRRVRNLILPDHLPRPSVRDFDLVAAIPRDNESSIR